MTVAAMQVESDPTTHLSLPLQEAIRDIGIPPRPAVLLKIQALIADPNSDFDELAGTISKDVALSAGILKVANSPFFGRCIKARTVHQGIVALGLNITARTVTGLMLRRAFPHLPAMDRFWDSSARIAQLSSWLVKRLGLESELSSGDAYTFGLFRDAGIAVLLSRIPGYEQTLAIANTNASRQFTAVEDDRHQSNHAQLGTMLARSWHLPEETCLATQYHHDLPALLALDPPAPVNCAMMIAVSQLAELLVQENSGLSLTCEWQKLGAACRAVLGITEDAEVTLAEEALEIASQQEF